MDNKFCSECGAQLTPEDRFCPECGYKIPEDNKSMAEQTPPPVEETDYYMTPKETDTSAYYTTPIEEVQHDYSDREDSLEKLDDEEKPEENYYNASPYFTPGLNGVKSEEFDPFKQNVDVKTTAYGDHTRRTSNILLLIIVMVFLLVGIIAVIVLLGK